MSEKYIIYGEKNGRKEDFKPVRGEKTVKEEVKRLNQVDDGISYGYRQVNHLKPVNPQTNRMY